MYTYIMKYYSALENKEILPFVTTWKKLEDVMLSEVVQTQEKTDLTYMWNLKMLKL